MRAILVRRPRRIDLVWVGAAFLAGVSFHLTGTPAVAGGDMQHFVLRQAAATHLPVRWQVANRTIAILVRTTCAACNANAGLYAKLARASTPSSGLRLVFLSAESPDTVRRWLATKAVTGANIVQVERPTEAGFVVAPTILVADESGRVQDVVMGKVGEQTEARLIARLSAPPTGEPLGPSVSQIRSVDETEATALGASAGYTVLDARPRGAARRGPSGYVIPVEELLVRAPDELPVTKPVLMDCRGQTIRQCRSVAIVLIRLGVPQLALLATGPESHR